MNTQVSRIKAKLTLLGDIVEEIDETSIIVTSGRTFKKTLIIGDGTKVAVSDKYDYIEHLYGTDYNLVRNKNEYKLIVGTASESKLSSYSKLDRVVLASNGVYNIVAMLSNNLYGVIDTNDRELINFNHYNIEVYRVNNKVVYVGYTSDYKQVYGEDGELYKVSDIISNGDIDIIICEDYVILYSIKGSSMQNSYIICDLEGNIKNRFDNSKLVNNGKKSQIIDSHGKIVLDNIYLAYKMRGN